MFWFAFMHDSCLKEGPAACVLTMGCFQLGADLINLPSQSQNLAYNYPHAGDSDIYCTQKQIEKKDFESSI